MYPFPPPQPIWPAFAITIPAVLSMAVFAGLIPKLVKRVRGRNLFGIIGIWIGATFALISLAIYAWRTDIYPVCIAILLGLTFLLLCLATVVSYRQKNGDAVPITLAFLVFLLSTCWMFSPAGHPIEASRISHCKNNLKHVGLAFHNYHDTHERFPPRAEGNPPVSWRVELLPFVDRKPIFDLYDQSAAWDSEVNRSLAETDVGVYSCPSSEFPRDEMDRWYTAYAIPVSKHGVYSDNIPIPLSKIDDGTSNTILVVESCGQRIVWTEPRDVGTETENLSINSPGDRIGHSRSLISAYHNSAHVLLADGSIRRLHPDIDSRLVAAFLSADTGDTGPESF